MNDTDILDALLRELETRKRMAAQRYSQLPPGEQKEFERGCYAEDQHLLSFLGGMEREQESVSS